MIRVRKIKLSPKNNKISMSYELLDEGRVKDEYSFTSSDPALPSLYKALQDLAPCVVEMCELPEEDVNKVMVMGVTFSYQGERQTMGVVITAQKSLSQTNQSLIFTTPYKTEDINGQIRNIGQLLSNECVIRLKDLHREAVRYINGERAQSDIF